MFEVEVHAEYVPSSSMERSMLFYFSVYFFFATDNNPRRTVPSDVASRGEIAMEKPCFAQPHLGLTNVATCHKFEKVEASRTEI